MSVPAPHVRQRWRDRDRRLRELGFESYDAYLASPHWRSTKASFRASDLPQVCICGEVDNLDLHHKTYARLGCEHLEDLILLCRNCHRMVHVLDRRDEMGINLVGFADTKRAERYAPATEARAVAARADYSDEHLHRFARKLANRIKQAMITGQLAGTDVLEIESVLDRADQRNQAVEHDQAA